MYVNYVEIFIRQNQLAQEEDKWLKVEQTTHFINEQTKRVIDLQEQVEIGYGISTICLTEKGFQ